MRAIRVHTYGGGPSLDEIPDPKLERATDVLIRVEGAGLCRTDLHILEGQWQEKSGVALPAVLGHENAGTVLEVGSAVDNVVPGDRVILHPLATCGLCPACRSGDDVHCTRSRFPGIDTDGGMADLLCTSARSVVPLAPGVEPAAVAALADAGLTAYHAVRKAVPVLRPGTTAIVMGAGGLGHIGIQVLRALTAARVVVLDTDEAALDLAKALGAHETVRVDGTHVPAVRELTDDAGAEVVLDFVGEGSAPADGIAMLRRAGSYYTIGYGGRVDIPTIDVISSEINVIGNLVGSYTDLVDLMALAADDLVRLHTTTYPLADFTQAFHDLEHGRVRGRAVLVP